MDETDEKRYLTEKRTFAIIMPKIKELCLTETPTNTHQAILLDGLNKLRQNGELIDITLIVNGCEYNAHKAVLSACSDYFKAMFNDTMAESGKRSVTLYGISHTGFDIIINYIYTSQLELSASNVQEVLAAATYLQMLPVIPMCSCYLGTHLDIENCVDIVTIAENYYLTGLRKNVYKFICEHFSEIAGTSSFYRFTPDHVENILKFNLPVDCTENEMLRFILLWFLHGKENEVKSRLPSAQRILKHIHYKQMTLKSLDCILDQVFNHLKINKLGHPLYKIIIEEARQPENSLDLNLCFTSFNSRGMELALVKVGGFGKCGITNEITYCLTSEQKWKHLTVIPHVDQCNFGTAVLKNNLYVVGGCFNQSLQEVIHPFGFKYNPRIDQWTKIAPLNVERCRFTLNVSGDKLYAVGGATEVEIFDGFESTNTCECYNSAEDSWQLIQPLPEYRTQHAGASLCVNGREKVYISGGIYRGNVVATLYCYDVDSQTWMMCTPMLTPRADHFMVSYGHKLYVCGGWRDNPLEMNRLRTQGVTIDSYNPLTDAWEVVTQVPTPKYHAGVVADGSKIYIIGGFHSDGIFFKDTAAVECYDISTDKWSFGDKSSQDYWEHCCVTLHIPKNGDSINNSRSSSYHLNF